VSAPEEATGTPTLATVPVCEQLAMVGAVGAVLGAMYVALGLAVSYGYAPERAPPVDLSGPGLLVGAALFVSWPLAMSVPDRAWVPLLRIWSAAAWLTLAVELACVGDGDGWAAFGAAAVGLGFVGTVARRGGAASAAPSAST
jgi:hypothetical protein